MTPYEQKYAKITSILKRVIAMGPLLHPHLHKPEIRAIVTTLDELIEVLDRIDSKLGREEENERRPLGPVAQDPLEADLGCGVAGMAENSDEENVQIGQTADGNPAEISS